MLELQCGSNIFGKKDVFSNNVLQAQPSDLDETFRIRRHGVYLGACKAGWHSTSPFRRSPWFKVVEHIKKCYIFMIEAVSGLKIELREAKSRADAQC